MTNFTFKTREEYLEYKEDWKKRFAEARRELHEIRGCRKEYLWQYRPKDITTVKRRTKIGPNPRYDPSKVYWEEPKAKEKCGLLLKERTMSKILAGQQREERLDKEAA